jgi:tetratricopeptide (TPR) repeat protein
MQSPVPSKTASAKAGATGTPGIPTWLPPYTAEQLALLKPSDTPIQVPAKRVFPDLSRFGYASNHRMEDVAESLKFTKMVATIVTESPHMYVFGEAAAELANAVAQYGPPSPAEPDMWQTASRVNAGGGKLSQAPLSAEAKSEHARGQQLGGARNLPGAIRAYKAAIAKSPGVPALQIALAEAHFANGDMAGAEEAYKAAAGIDATLATAHTGLAEVYEKKGEVPKARRSLAEALAYYPTSKRALAIANRLTNGAASTGLGRVKPFRVFLDVDQAGAVRVAATEDMPAQMYASCRAVMRYEPEVRSVIFEEPEETPYYLSVVEEVVCLEAAIGAYLFEQQRSRDAKPERSIEALLEIAHGEGLLGYAMFEILGQHRPERARTAPPDVHRAVVQYVEKHVLGEGEPLPDGVYTAAR